ncbi:unnamed protein product [Darwinula stevensoni]|uniref:RING-type E3 ubiquitin transferase n=1 Tax=Darwinula stevensoni TaxID=69355 RepID=A0A7R8X4I0_9CRUS|nr:unnamed protein product [Darwinula stevensoni]CAG0883737.1 unnamed protein product [Darwinula stevensoni]
MGVFTSRQSNGVEEVDLGANNAYRFPPKSELQPCILPLGNYFGTHFIMGGERFDTPQPEAYLFGDNLDLNFLGSRPTPFPYPAPQANEPTKTLKALINIRKESLHFTRVNADQDVASEVPPPPPPETRVPEEEEKEVTDGQDSNNHVQGNPRPVSLPRSTKFNIEFTFDCDVRCAITVHYFCTEELTPHGLIYKPRNPQMSSYTYHYKRGANQHFCQVEHIFDPTEWPEADLSYDYERDFLPIQPLILEPWQSHATLAVVEKYTDGTYGLKAFKQKLFVDGLCYLLQEVYGIENKNVEMKNDDETEDSGAECVICMSDTRDTLILPCRHLCLCNCCADSLRYQANNCPICRSPFRALLQIRPVQKASGSGNNTGPNLNTEVPQDGIPPGYEAVSLIEALNGPITTYRSHHVGRDRSSTGSADRVRLRGAGGSLRSRPTPVPEGLVSHCRSASVPKDRLPEQEDGSGDHIRDRHTEYVELPTLTELDGDGEPVGVEEEETLLDSPPSSPKNRGANSDEAVEGQEEKEKEKELEIERRMSSPNSQYPRQQTTSSTNHEEELSDYYTPEDPVKHILDPPSTKVTSVVPLATEEEGLGDTEGELTPSPPGTPQSLSSHKSSSNQSSYSSRNSTHLLLRHPSSHRGIKQQVKEPAVHQV